MSSTAYDAALRQRDSVTVWFTEKACVAWKAELQATRSVQPRCSGLLIATALTLRAVFHVALRQTERLINPIVNLLGMDLRCRTTMSRGTDPLERPHRDGRPKHLLVDRTEAEALRHSAAANPPWPEPVPTRVAAWAALAAAIWTMKSRLHPAGSKVGCLHRRRLSDQAAGSDHSQRKRNHS